VPVACELVTALQTLATRQFDAHDPVVVTISRIEAGTTHNVIPDSARLKGTMRTLSATHRARLREAVTRLATHLAAAHGLTAQVTITPGFPVTRCDPRAVALGQSVTHALFGPQAFHHLPAPIMGAEDFAYVLDLVPGAMFFLGFAAEGEDWTRCCGIHSPRMMLDETVLPNGAALLAALAERYLVTGWASSPPE
jgi:hippurate hydrolase